MADVPRRTMLLALLAAMTCGSGALASWQVAGAASTPITSGSLVAATGLGATPGCILLLPKVTLGWTPTASLQATGYRVFRKAGAGAYGLITTVAGRTTSSYLDTAVSLSTTYTYYVQAYVGSWTADSATASATTAALCL